MMIHRLAGFSLAALGIVSLCVGACSDETVPYPGAVDAGRDAAGVESGSDASRDASAVETASDASTRVDAANSPVASIPATEQLQAPSLSAPVDVVRDQWGIPHIYGETLPDVLFGEGYVMARDRFVQMDLARHQASGTIAELAGTLSPDAVDGDIAIRAHHLRSTAQKAFDALKASTDARDQAIVLGVAQFSAGVNAYLDQVRAGQFAAPADVTIIDDFTKAAPWSELDSLTLGELEAFDLSFDADSEITASLVQSKAALIFDQATDPSLLARRGMGADLEILAPLDPTYTIPGWTGMNGDGSTAASSRGDDGNMYALLEADRHAVMGLGNDHLVHPSRGSNNWVVGPALSQSGHALIANDTHLPLGNPSTFYLVHLSARSGAVPLNVMGAAFPGIPGIILGMNDHVAWGATVSLIDVTDVYRETIVTCDDGVSPCVVFQGAKVALLPRQETFSVGAFGAIDKTVTVTLYDVPHHGPIIPRVTASHDGIEPLGTSELSIRYTGHEPGQLFRAALGLCTSGTMQDAVAALDRDFKYGGQNWALADDQGNFGWTEIERVPRRSAASAPWRVLPGDGSAEWGPDMDPKYIPHAYNPAAGFLATANNDPIGVTDDGDPFFDEPIVDGAPLYLGARYDFGSRIGRITKRLTGITGAGNKLTIDDMQSVQADTITEVGQALAPTLMDAAGTLAAEIATPGVHPELSALAAGASVNVKAILPPILPLLAAWTFDTPSAMPEDVPTPAQIADSRAALLSAAWIAQFYDAALGDEIAKIGSLDQSFGVKLLIRAATHPELLKTAIDPVTHDPVIFDDLATPQIESKRQIAARALVATIDALAARLGPDATAWRWGQVHTLTLEFAVSLLQSLQIPPPNEAMHVNGFPRHGDVGTVDVGGEAISKTDFTYSNGPAIRFVCELDPVLGPRGRNALPGGETFDPASPHYRDQLELWRQNKTFDLPFRPAEVLAGADLELTKNHVGRLRISP
jgi:penicillin amidase